MQKYSKILIIYHIDKKITIHFQADELKGVVPYENNHDQQTVWKRWKIYCSFAFRKMGVPVTTVNFAEGSREEHGISQEIINEFKGKTSLLYAIGVMMSEESQDKKRLTIPEKMFHAQKETVKRLAQEGPCIFVGRCADQILKDDNQLLRVYIYASDMEDRIKRIKKNKHISQEEALDRIAYKDRQRRDYYNFYTGHEWGKMENYDICLNTSVLSEEECVELLMKLAG